MLLGSRRHPAVSVVVSYLAAHISEPVFYHAPAKDRPEIFVRVTRVGGPKINIVTDGPMLTIECWHPVCAETLALRVLDLMENAPGEYIEYTDDDGTPEKAWITSYREVGAPTAHPESEYPLLDRWVLTVRLGIATNV